MQTSPNNYQILEKIKESKKYSDLDEDIILEEIEKYKRRNNQFERTKEKKILKDVKAELHKLYGSFKTDDKKIEKYLEELRKSKSDKKSNEIIKNILQTNPSSKERKNFYSKIYKRIFGLSEKPKIIVDIGSGINPFSFGYMDNEKIKYYSYDINKEDSKFLNDFYKIMKIDGQAQILDCSKVENIRILPKSDMVFMFKFVDVIEKTHSKGHKLAEQIVNELVKKTKYIAISFPTKTLTGKKMNFPYRGWIEMMLNRINKKFKILKFENEIFYIISCN